MFLPHDIPEYDSQSEDEELCPLDEEEDEHLSKVQEVEADSLSDNPKEEDEHHAKLQLEEDEHHAKLQLEEDEQLARAIQESLYIGSPPRRDVGSLFQPFSLFSTGYR